MTSQVFLQRGTKEGPWCGWCTWLSLPSLYDCGCSQSLCQGEEPFPLLLLPTSSQLFSPALTEGANKSKHSPDHHSQPFTRGQQCHAACTLLLLCVCWHFPSHPDVSGRTGCVCAALPCPQQILSLPRRRLGCCPVHCPAPQAGSSCGLGW